MFCVNIYTMNQKQKWISGIIIFIVVSVVFLLATTHVYNKSQQPMNNQKLSNVLDKDTVKKSQDKESVHIAFVQEIDNKKHGFYDGRDLGEISGYRVLISGENIAFTRMVNGIEHVIYNGKDLGEGKDPTVNDNNITYIRMIEGKSHIIHNNEDFGEILIIDRGYGMEWYQVAGNNVGFFREVNGETHVIYNKQDMGEGIYRSLKLGGNSFAFLKPVNNDPQGTIHIVYNGKDLRGAQQIYSVSDKYVFYHDVYKKPFKGYVQMYFKNMEELGQGQYITVDGDGNYLLTGIYVTSDFVYNGKNVGKAENATTKYVDSGNYVFVREVDGKNHVIYNGKDIGEGDDPVIGGSNLAFIREINGKKHIIYNNEDMGEGNNVDLSSSGERLLLKREINGILNAFYDGKNLGVCDKNCYPAFSDSKFY